MAMTIMSQRECLRKIVIINFASRNVPQLPRPPNAFWGAGERPRLACWQWRPRHRKLFSSQSIVARRRNEHARARALPRMQAASRERSRSFLNQFPCITQMLFRGENIAESQTNHGLTAQFCLIQIRATRSVNRLDDSGIERVDLVFCAKANHAHRDRRG